MSEVIENLRSRLRAQKTLKEFWERDVADNEKAIAAEESKQFAAHRLSAACDGIELNDAEIGWIGNEHSAPARAVENYRKLIAFAESDIRRCENEMNLLSRLIEKLEAKTTVL